MILMEGGFYAFYLVDFRMRSNRTVKENLLKTIIFRVKI